jgi:hypothetical protein
MGGPGKELLANLARAYVRKTGRRKLVVQVPVPGPVGKAMRKGYLLPGPAAAVGRQTFDQWLDATAAKR